MLRADHNLNLGAVGVAGSKEGAKGCFCQRPPRHRPDHIDIAEKCRRLLVNRRVVDIIGRAALYDPPAAHQRNLVGHAHRLVRLVRHQQDRRPLFLQDIQRGVADAVAQTVVQPGKGLVHQHDARARGQRARQRHALLLAPGKLVGMLFREVGQIDLFQQLGHPRRLVVPAAAQAEGDVAFHGQMREQREILKHQPDRPGFGRQEPPLVRHHRPVDPHAALIRLFDPRDHPQRRGLAATRGTQQAGHLPCRNRQRQVIDDRPAPEDAGQVLHL